MSQAPSYEAVFISPHVDDVAFSCGGTLARLGGKGKSLVISVFSNHGRHTDLRKREEAQASRIGAYEVVFLDLPDLPQRQWSARLPQQRHRLLSKKDQAWVQQVGKAIQGALEKIEYKQIYFPLGAGFHVDHDICFSAALKFPWKGELLFYEDAPSVLGPGVLEERLYYLLGNILNLEERKPVQQLEQEIRPLKDFVLSRPIFSKSLYRFLSGGLGLTAHWTLKQRLKKLKKSSRPFPDLKLEPHYVSIDDFFDLKIKKIWAFKSQAQLFFHSREETENLFNHFHRRTEAGNQGLFERFWRVKTA